MKMLDLAHSPHRRFNPLNREWVLVSPHRMERPWQGQIETAEPRAGLAYDPNCFMCPGNRRASGAKNPNYTGCFVFDNDFPALKGNGSEEESSEGLLRVHGESGICRVVCFSPRHNLSVSEMGPHEIRQVVEVWIEQYERLGARHDIRHVQIFENRGAMMGCSNPHPHGQIWATSSVPNEPAKEMESFLAYRRDKGSCLLCDYLGFEVGAGDRVVTQNDFFLAVVPFWANWPYETLLLPKQHAGSMADLSGAERDALAAMIQNLTAGYDNLFRTPFPYSMGFHQRPTDPSSHPEWHLHAHYFPPLLRSATVRKFMVGFEMLAGPQRDMTPEQAAEELRNACGGRSGTAPSSAVVQP